MRISVQLRKQGLGNGPRWHRSVYVDSAPRAVSVFFDEMTARAGAPRGRPPLADVGALLFVVESVNTQVGTSGQLWIDQARFE